MPESPTLSDGLVDLVRVPGDPGTFAVEVDGVAVGSVGLQEVGDGTGDLRWELSAAYRGRGYATRAVRLLVDYAFGDLGLGRVQARVPPADGPAVRVARRAGMRNEGLVRGVTALGTGDYALLGRLREDPPPGDRTGFRALLNSFLPLKRTIAQALVRDREGRVLMCHPTYKDDWDLPGGVVERLESPHTAAGREIVEELGVTVAVGRLVLSDWLPPWGGWDDALCLVFDGGCHDAALLDGAVLQAHEIREAGFLTLPQVRDRAADYTARRVEAALAALAGEGPAYTESGR